MRTPGTAPDAPASTTLTVRLAPDVKGRLGRLADATHRTRSFLAAEAITAYVAHEAEIIGGIERGLADMKAGRPVPHDEAMARLEATITAAERGVSPVAPISSPMHSTGCRTGAKPLSFFTSFTRHATG
jgi:predicted transcriptional regulator